MLSKNELGIVKGCLSFASRTEKIFCDLGETALQAFERTKAHKTYPKNRVLFLEGQAARGLFVLCSGQVKMSVSAGDGKTFILKVARPGELLGLSATISGSPYEVTAETLEPCEVSIVKREDFLRFLKDNPDACFKVTEQLGSNYRNACHEVRSLGLSKSMGEKLAQMLLDWSEQDGECDAVPPCVKLPLTHEEIAQMIGSCRETVTRLFAILKQRHIAECQASTLYVHDRNALKALAENRLPRLRVNGEQAVLEHRSRVA
jgi:CRP/FNR family transcriptional regulator, cyclic AMP receptor protein